MYALGELGIGLGLAWVVSYRNRAAVDFRLVLLGSILPDLIDKPSARSSISTPGFGRTRSFSSPSSS